METVLNSPGDTAPELRRAALDRAKGNRAVGDLPTGLARYVDAVALHAYKVTDADVAALQHSGNSDDALFEITVAAAVGAALHRLERGMAALRGSEGEPD
jgi:alkylhydroperoxidase family enzyme